MTLCTICIGIAGLLHPGPSDDCEYGTLVFSQMSNKLVLTRHYGVKHMTNKAGTDCLTEAFLHLRAERGFLFQLQSLLTGKTGNPNLLFLSETPNLSFI